jgi:hypothetical protein
MGIRPSFSDVSRVQQVRCYETEFRRPPAQPQGFLGVTATPSDEADSASPAAPHFLTTPQEMEAR